MTLPVALLAGGLATRLGPVSATLPKALIEIEGRPFLAHQLALLRAHQVPHVVLCVGHLADQIEATIGDGRAFGIDVVYSRDGDTPLGTAGAIVKALPLLGPAFFVMYGDSYLTCDYREIARRFTACGKKGMMTVFENRGQHDHSNVEYQDGVIRRYDKRDTSGMHHIDYGLSAFQASAFHGYPAATKIDLATVFGDLLASAELCGYEVQDRFYEIGSPSGLAETRRYIAAKEIR